VRASWRQVCGLRGMKKDIAFTTIEPKILYFGTPVALITTIDDLQTPNIGPISSAWALGWTLVLGIECGSKTYQNLLHQKECVINFPSADLFEHVEKIASLTGANPVPDYKKGRYQFNPDKFTAGGFTPLKSDLVAPPRIAECQIQMEAVFNNVMDIADDPIETSPVAAIAVRVISIHADEDLVLDGKYIDPSKWNPLIYNFRHYFGLGEELGKTFKAEV
jgi:flavin reductase (DIM6/NTAB) family NADH-FMN oxidoreductase RutF